MGLLNDIGEKFSNTIWSSVNTATNSMAETANSFLYSGGTIVNTGLSSNGIGQFNEIANDTYFEYLKNYHFVSALLDIYCSCLNDAISKSDFHVTITGDEDHTKRANKFIDDIQLKQFVLDNLRDMVFRGVYAFGIKYTPEYPKLYALSDPYSCNIMTNTRDVIGYELNGNIVSNDNIVCYYYTTKFAESIGGDNNDKESNPYSITNMPKPQEKEKEIDTSAIDNRVTTDLPEELKKLVVKFKKYTPYGLFDSKLFRIFQMYSLECAMYYLSLRESMKPTLLGMATGGRQINLANAIDMANAIENILNSPTTGLAQMADPTVYMNQLVWVMLNNIRVMPTLEQYQNLTDIAQNDSSGKREKLAQELDNVRKEILQELTIPEELFGGTGNRWDQYSRSDRFMTTIDSLLFSISRMVKQIICKYTGISTVSISFNIDTASLSASYDTKNKLAQLAEKVADIGRILGSFKDIVENEYSVPVNAYNYLKDQCCAIDEKLGSILISDLNQTNDSEESGSSVEDEDSGGEDGGFEL